MEPIGKKSRVWSAVNATIVPALIARADAVVDREPRDEVDERRREAEEGADEREERPPDHLLAHLEVGEPLVLAAVALDRVARAREHLREQHARDGQRLLGQRAHLRERLLRLLAQPPPDPPHAVGEVDEERHDDEREERQLPRQHRHRDERGGDDHDVREDRGGGVGDDGLDPGDVVLEPRLDLARSGSR